MTSRDPKRVDEKNKKIDKVKLIENKNVDDKIKGIQIVQNFE